MKRIKRYVVPAIFTVLGIWMIANKTSFLKIMGIIMVAISAVGITLHVTDREEAKVPKIGYSILSGLVGAVGAFVMQPSMLCHLQAMPSIASYSARPFFQSFSNNPAFAHF